MINFNPIQSSWASSLTSLTKMKKTISQGEFDLFKKEFVFQKLQGMTFGEAFCQRFGIVDNMLTSIAIMSDTEAEYLIKTLGYIK